MKRIKLYPILSAAAILAAVIAFVLLCYLLQVELEDHYKVFVVTGNHASYYSIVFSNPGVLACLAAVLVTGAAAIGTDARAIHQEERGSLVLLTLVCLTLLSFALLFWLAVKML
ncbi:MAG: hypothetical protein IJK24_00455 [Oscillospiraceae bacterium]|nr:hypothetical protein [Oscillospiraceae bacterium]MBQ6159393.1 hypothetical protein [Oscillospiraceae bacterium]